MGDMDPKNRGKAQSGPTTQPSQQAPSFCRAKRFEQKAQDYLQQALDEELPMEKNYHIRHALQLLQLEQSERPK